MSNNTNILSKSKRAHTNSVSTSIGRQSEYYRPKKSEPWYPKPCRYLTLKCFNILGTATGISGSSAYLSKLEDSVSEVTYSVIKTTCILSADNKMRFTCSGNLTVRVEDKEFASGKTKNAYKVAFSSSQLVIFLILLIHDRCICKTPKYMQQNGSTLLGSAILALPTKKTRSTFERRCFLPLSPGNVSNVLPLSLSSCPLTLLVILQALIPPYRLSLTLFRSQNRRCIPYNSLRGRWKRIELDSGPIPWGSWC